MRIATVRRGRTIKIVVSALVVVCILYILYTTPDAHTRAKEAIQSRFKASRSKTAPTLIPGMFCDEGRAMNDCNHS